VIAKLALLLAAGLAAGSRTATTCPWYVTMATCAPAATWPGWMAV
jgi:hypothetical protein